MGNVAVMPMVKCAGCGSAWVRSDVGGYCSDCEELAVKLEQKRLAEIQRNRNYGVPPRSSELGGDPGMGEPVPCEQRAGLSLGEMIVAAGVLAGSIGISCAAGTLLWMGARWAVGFLYRWSA